MSNGAPQPPGEHRGTIADSTWVVRFGLATKGVTYLAQFPSLQLYAPGTQNRFVMQVPFSPMSRFATWRGGYVFNDGASAVFRFYSSTGILDRTLELALPKPEPVAPADKKAFARATVKRAPDVAGAVREALSEVAYPAQFPRCDGLLVGATGEIWVREYAHADAVTVRWRVFNAEGVFEGSLDLPVSFTPLEADSATVLGRWVGEFDVEHAGVFRLERGPVNQRSQATATGV